MGSDMLNLVPLSGALSILNSPPSMLMRSFMPTSPNEFSFLPVSYTHLTLPTILLV